MCGKGVGNGLKYIEKQITYFIVNWSFLTVSHIPVIRFSCHCARRSTFGCIMTVQISIKIVRTVFEKFEVFIERWEEKTHDYISFSDCQK